MIQRTELHMTCPDLHSQADGRNLGRVLYMSPGVDDVEIDYITGQVRVVTANQDGGIDIKRKLSESGFPAKD